MSRILWLRSPTVEIKSYMGNSLGRADGDLAVMVSQAYTQAKLTVTRLDGAVLL